MEKKAGLLKIQESFQLMIMIEEKRMCLTITTVIVTIQSITIITTGDKDLKRMKKKKKEEEEGQ